MNACVLSGRAIIVAGGVWPGVVLIYAQAEAGLCGDSRQAVIQAMTLLTAMVLSRYNY